MANDCGLFRAINQGGTTQIEHNTPIVLKNSDGINKDIKTR